MSTAGPTGSILMISTHGYVGAEPELGRPDTGGQVVFVLELAKRFGSAQSGQFVNGILDRVIHEQESKPQVASGHQPVTEDHDHQTMTDDE